MRMILGIMILVLWLGGMAIFATSFVFVAETVINALPLVDFHPLRDWLTDALRDAGMGRLPASIVGTLGPFAVLAVTSPAWVLLRGAIKSVANEAEDV